MKYDRIFERNKLESSVDFLKNRSGSHSDRFFSGNILCPKDHEAEAGSQSSTGRDFLTLPLVLPPTVAGFFLAI